MGRPHFTRFGVAAVSRRVGRQEDRTRRLTGGYLFGSLNESLNASIVVSWPMIFAALRLYSIS